MVGGLDMTAKGMIMAAGMIAMSAGLGRAELRADNGLITKPSKYDVRDTVEKFEAAIKARAAAGWIVFSRIDHAAAAKDAGLSLRPRTVIIFGNPRGGTPPMTRNPTLAIDLPLKALVWQDEQGKVWFTYNSSEYGAKVIYPRHALAVPDDAAKGLEKFLADVSDASTM